MGRCTMIHRLDDLVDGLLPEKARREVNRHIRTCPECRDEVRWLRSLRQRTGQIVLAVSPSRDLWPGIQYRVARMTPRPRVGRGYRIAMHPAWACALSAAACILFMLIAPWTQSPIVSGGQRGCAPSSLSHSGTSPAPPQRPDAAAQVKSVMSRHVAMVDDAIQQLLTALREDPTDLKLVHMLRKEYRRKVSLVVSTARLVNELDATTTHPTG